MDDLLTTAEAAHELGINDSRVRHYVREGRLPGERKGRDVLIRRADLAALKRRVYRKRADSTFGGQDAETPPTY